MRSDMSVDIRQLDSSASPAMSRTPVIVTVPRRHPWRWAGAGVIGLLAIWAVRVLVTTSAFGWPTVAEHMFSANVLHGVARTLYMTFACSVLGVILGTGIAIMRMSVNPILNSVATFYQWFFRGTPALVQLIFWFNLSTVFPSIAGRDTNTLMTPFLAALLGLGLNFSAYYSEIVRAGILSVDEGQSDAASAYGMSRTQTLRLIVLPQAMRVIIPPTGNEFIGMLKFTSLATVVSFGELLNSVQTVYNVTYEIIPLLIVAALWYLILTSVLSTFQYFVERRVSRGTSRNVQPLWIVTAVRRVLERTRAA